MKVREGYKVEMGHLEDDQAGDGDWGLPEAVLDEEHVHDVALS